LDQVFLSDTELYYTTPDKIAKQDVVIVGEEVKHISQVMRNSIGDEIFITDGTGKIFRTSIKHISKGECIAGIIQIFEYSDPLKDFVVCIPRLKNNDKLELALEKCVELGITNILVFQSSRCIGRGSKSERWNKISIGAIKQSLRSFLPTIEFLDKFENFNNLSGIKIIFDQSGDILFKDYLSSNSNDNINADNKKKYLIFGPEGGLSEDEINLIKNKKVLKLNNNRLRSETAVINAASILSHYFTEVQ